MSFASQSPIPVPHHWKSTIKESLARDIEQKIIKPVDNNTPAELCSPMVITMKKDGTPRRTIEVQKLNFQTAIETITANPHSS